MSATRLKDDKVSKSAKHEQQALFPPRRNPPLANPQAKLPSRAPPAGAAVADEASGLVVPLAEQKINRVFERAGHAMIILRRDEDIAIKRTDLGGPRLGVRLTVLPHDGRHRLVEERQVEVFDVHEF